MKHQVIVIIIIIIIITIIIIGLHQKFTNATYDKSE